MDCGISLPLYSCLMAWHPIVVLFTKAYSNAQMLIYFCCTSCLAAGFIFPASTLIVSPIPKELILLYE
jgi:hypothetical protein